MWAVFTKLPNTTPFYVKKIFATACTHHANLQRFRSVCPSVQGGCKNTATAEKRNFATAV